MTTTRLRLTGVSKRYGAPEGRPVLAALDLDVGAGEVVVVFGRSGSGKTTLLSIAAGFVAPDAGEVLIDGTAVRDDVSWASVAVLPQSLGLLDELTVRENVTLPDLLAEGASGARVDRLLERLQLAHLADRLPGETSLGEQQRTALARTLVTGPRVLVADEPVSHQNPALAEVMVEEIAALAAGGTACLLATHDASVVRIADRVVELHAGTIRPRRRHSTARGRPGRPVR